MASTVFLLFLAGLLTILLPCILPLIPVVVGASISGRSKLRPLLVCAGMLVSFVGSTFILYVFLNQFPQAADIIRLGSYYLILLFGLGFMTHHQGIRYSGTALGALFFYDKGWPAVLVALAAGMVAMALGGWIAQRLQQAGADLQTEARTEFGNDSSITAFIIGLTLGLIWVPCAGPALAFALTLVREESGAIAIAALTAYGIGASIPLLIVGYGGQYAVQSLRTLSRFTGIIKTVAGVVLVLTAVALRYDFLLQAQVWITERTGYGNLGNRIEEHLFSSSPDSQPNTMNLPRIVRAPELNSPGPWHNSEPLTMAGLKGKVVLIDFWTYSCINCIRTLPYLRGYWDKYRDTGKFVIIGVHTPEFVFEQLPENVKMAIKKYSLTYPVVQDNDYGTWQAFANRYWPAKYLIDAEGYVRYTHFGEGEYEETDKAIASLLAEIGVEGKDMAIEEEEAGGSRSRSPETYIGERSWPAFGNALGSPGDQIITYKAPETLVLNKYYLDGQWQLVDRELQIMHSQTGDIRMRFLGGEINLVLGLEEGAKPVQAEVLIDGKSVKTFTVTEHDLYELFKGQYGEHEMILKLKGAGVEAYAFTFGA